MIQSLSIARRVAAFSQLGEVLRAAATNADPETPNPKTRKVVEAASHSSFANGWFTPPMVSRALLSLAEILEAGKVALWLEPYSIGEILSQKKVLVVSAGNLPAVGFFDWLCVMATGFRYLGKLSTDDRYLLPAIAQVLAEIEPAFEGRSEFTEAPARDFDAVIATGSANTSRYFEYYFSKWPAIIRSSRTGVAVFQGNETPDQLQLLADDIMLYYGLGCRNVSACLIPEGYDPLQLVTALSVRSQELALNSKWANNYDYQKAMMLINNQPFFDTGALLFRISQQLFSPVAVVNLIPYATLTEATALLSQSFNQLQCIVSSTGWFTGSIPFGTAQNPGLNDYADGVDVVQFLLNI